MDVDGIYITIYIYITVCNQQHDNVDGHSPAPTGAGFSPCTDWLACQEKMYPPKKGSFKGPTICCFNHS